MSAVILAFPADRVKVNDAHRFTPAVVAAYLARIEGRQDPDELDGICDHLKKSVGNLFPLDQRPENKRALQDVVYLQMEASVRAMLIRRGNA